MAEKLMSAEDVVGQLSDGMIIGIGGWGSRRKPMALVRAIARSSLRDLTIASFGGPDVGMLCAAGKVSKVIEPFVALDQATPANPHSATLEPHFRAARQSAAVVDVPYDEGMFLLALQAAAWRVPFLPTRAGLGSDLLRDNPSIRTIKSPYDDRDEVVAVPALHLDAALVHVNRADATGNASLSGPDPYFDDLFLAAARSGYLSAERIVSTAELTSGAPLQALRINRMHVAGVVEAPRGAHFTSCEPDYKRDEPMQDLYMKAAASAEAWEEYRSEWLTITEDEYRAKCEAGVER